jgi:signal transduction histidine kinase
MEPTTPPPAAPDRVAPRRWLLLVGIWTAFGLLISAQQTIGSSLRGAPVPWSTTLLLWMPIAYAWALATPAIVWLGRRFPFERGTWLRSAVVHLAACCALIFTIGLGHAVNAARLLPPTAPQPPFERAVQLFVAWLLYDGLLYWTVLSVGFVVEHQRRLRERERERAELETQLLEVELQALKAQLQPHFLFNALHTIGSLVRAGDRDNAIRVVAGLGDLLRRVLDDERRQEVPLQDELAFVNAYLAIEQIRFRDRLAVAIAVESEALDAAVPHLILQPLVENAIRHGIAPRAASGRVEVRARRAGGQLEITVRDDGVGLAPAPDGRGTRGMGLSNTRARLARLYGDDGRLSVVNAPDGGCEARLTLPYRPAATAPIAAA